MVSWYTHNPGDGLHYVNSAGVTSEISILYNLHLVAIYSKIGTLPALWNEAYPEDPMTEIDADKIIFSGIAVSSTMPYSSPDDVSLAIYDLLTIRCDKLMQVVKNKLLERGITL